MHSDKFLLILLLIPFIILISSQNVYAFDDGFFWDFGNYALDYSQGGNGLTSGFTIIDSGLVNGVTDTLSVFVESKTSGGTTIETINITLDDASVDGEFTVDHLLFMEQESEFSIDDTVLITVNDNCDEAGEPGAGTSDGNCDPLVIETLSGSLGDSVKIISDSSSPSFIEIDLIETGPNTGIFTRQLTFCSTPGCSNAANAVLEVSSGDVFSVEDTHTNAISSGLISGDPNRFAIIVEDGGTIEATATPSAGPPPVTDFIDIDPPGWSGSPGRGSGGLVNPGLVVDSVAPSPVSTSSGSGCSGDCSPPTVGIDSNLRRIVENGFSFNDNPVNAELYYTPYPLVKVNVGQQNKVELKIFDDGGFTNIAHVGLGFGLGNGESFDKSRATINLDMTRDGQNILSVFDPENVLENVAIITDKTSCNSTSSAQCLKVMIFHTFRAPLQFNMLATYIWDHSNNSWQNYYNHGVHIIGDSLNPPKTKVVAFGTNEMRGLFTLTQIDIYEDKWIDEFGNIYIYNGNEKFDKIYTIPKEKIYDEMTSHGCDRMCNWFESYKLQQELLAMDKSEKILFGKNILGDSKGFVSSPNNDKVKRSENMELQNRINNEIKKATELFEESFGVKNNF